MAAGVKLEAGKDKALIPLEEIEPRKYLNQHLPPNPEW